MKPLLFILLSFFSSIVHGQWVNVFSINTSLATINHDICFTSEYDGMYFNSNYYLSSPSSTHGTVNLYNTFDGATNWTYNKGAWSHGQIPFGLISVISQSTIYSLLSFESLYSIEKTYNNGMNWQTILGGAGWLRGFSAIDTSTFYYTYSALNSKIYLSKYINGVIVSKIDSFPNFTPANILFTDTLTGYAISRTSSNTNNNIIYKTITGGNNWQISFSDSTIYIFNIKFPSQNIGYGVCKSGKIIKTSNGGNTWQFLNSSTTKNLQNLWFINDSIGYACGDSGVIIKTIDAGATWHQQTTGVSSPFNKIFFVNDSVGFAKTGTEVYKINSTVFASIFETSQSNKINIFPNPSIDGFYYLKFPDKIKQSKNLSIVITNCLGQIFNNFDYIVLDDKTIQINLTNLTKGLYVIKTVINGRNYNVKIEKEQD